MAKRKSLKLDEPELPNMPEIPAIAKAARALMAVRDEIDDVNEQLNKKHEGAKKKLLDLMTVEEKAAVVVDGITFRRVHKDASDEIRILTKKGKKQKEEEND